MSKQDILDMAERLGKAIADSPQARKLRETQGELDKHDDVKKLLEDYHQQIQAVEQKEQSNQPVEVEDKQKLQDLHGKLVASDVFKQYTGAQVDYVDLMRQVSDTIRSQVGNAEPGQEQSGEQK